MLLDDYTHTLTRRRLSPATIRLRLFYLAKIETALGDLTTVTMEQLEWWLAEHPHWSLNTQQTAIASIRSFYKWALDTGRMRENPAVEILRVRVHRRPGRMASEAEVRGGLARATSVQDKAMILLGAECGFRLSEIASLHRENRSGMWLTIVGKGNVQRTVAASPELVAVLEEIEQTMMRWNYYFPGRSGGHTHVTTIWRHIRDVADVNPHSLRHRAGDVVYRGTGKDIRATQVFLGHANSHTTEIYIHVQNEDLLRAASASRIAA